MIKQFYQRGDPNLGLSQVINGYLAQVNGPFWSLSNWFHIPPGVSWKYSHIGTALAAFLLEILESTPFHTYCETNIFQPLGMFNTHWFLYEYKENISRVAYPHSWDKKLQRYNTLPSYGFADYPDGALKTSVLDYFNFITMFLNGGLFNGVQVLSSASVSLMTTLVPIRGEYDRQTYGMWEIFKGQEVVGHDGGERGWRSFAGFDPVSKDGIIWFANTWPRCECMVELAKEIFVNWFGSDVAAEPIGLVSNNQFLVSPKASQSSIGSLSQAPLAFRSTSKSPSST